MKNCIHDLRVRRMVVTHKEDRPQYFWMNLRFRPKDILRQLVAELLLRLMKLSLGKTECGIQLELGNNPIHRAEIEEDVVEFEPCDCKDRVDESSETIQD